MIMKVFTRLAATAGLLTVFCKCDALAQIGLRGSVIKPDHHQLGGGHAGLRPRQRFWPPNPGCCGVHDASTLSLRKAPASSDAGRLISRG